jgi:hypothetical protein
LSAICIRFILFHTSDCITGCAEWKCRIL